MEISEIYKQLTELFHEIFVDDSITLDSNTTAADIEGWDSFTNLSLLVGVESKFGIKFDTGEIDSLDSVGDLVRTIQKKAS